MMIVACGMPSFSASTTPTWPKPVVGLQSREHEVDLLGLDRLGQRLGDAIGVGSRQRVGLDVDGTVGAARERRITWAARAGPAEQTMTSPPCFSFSRSASSSA
jgi:hypothetical protein